MKQRLIKVYGKVRTEPKFPAGFMDVIQIDKTGENFRLIYDVKGRFIVHRITKQAATYKLCRVRAVATGPKNVPFLYTSDGRTIRYADLTIKVHDVIRLDININKIMDSIKFEAGNLCMVTSKGGSIGSKPAWGPRDPSSNPAWEKLV